MAVVGTLFLTLTHAATSSLASEAESGTPQGNASIADDAGASGAKYVKFGGGASSGCDQAAIQKLVDSVSATNLETNLRKLVQDDSKPAPNELISRHISEPGNQIKVDWAKQQYATYGLQVIDQAFTSDDGFALNNAVGRVTGSDPNSFYAVGGHIDSINSQDQNTTGDPAPGGIDDGTGVVVAMEAGRILKGFQPCLKTSLDFIGFNDEEENSGGAAKYITDMATKTFKGVYNVDMVSYSPGGVMCDIHRYDNDARDKFLADKLASVNTTYQINQQMSSVAYHEDDTDTWNFWSAGLPGLYTNECTPDDNYPGYHSQTDSVTYVNFESLVKTTKTMVAALAELASQ
jgi:hypothetical protein